MLIRNRVKCRLCGDVIESVTVHDFKRCKCGEIFVDGGLEYCHCGAKTSIDNVIVMVEYKGCAKTGGL